MFAPLTKRQKEILDFINLYFQMNSLAPSLDEIKSHFKLKAVSTVHEHIEKLKSKGYLTKHMNQARGIRTTLSNDLKQDFIEINLVGYISSDSPVKSIENPKPILVNKSLVSENGRFYALKVAGNGMNKDGIFEGDLVIVKSQNTAIDGDMILATVENGFTVLKMYSVSKNRIKLQSPNSEIKPQFYEDIEIKGKIVALIRQFNK